MRLTIRSLLAYLDNLLSPEDAKEIAQKIEESEFASKLVPRLRDVVRRLRLAAPAVNDQRPEADANTVAEYLDNTLPSGQVLDFEKVCLESDVHLAEVAACHQILALVLGEAAEVSLESRQRMYHLPKLVAEEPPALPTAMAAAAVAAAGDGRADGPPPLVESRVPDYLRSPVARRRWLPFVAAMLLVLIATLAGLVSTGQIDLGFSGPRDERQTARDGNESPVPPDDRAAAKTPSLKATSSVPADQPGKPPEAAAKTGTAPGEAGKAGVEGVAGSKPAAVAKPEAGAPGGERPAGGAAGGVLPGGAAPAKPAVAVPPADVPPVAPSPKPGLEGAPAEPHKLGRLLTGDGLLLQFNPKSNAWFRVEQDIPIFTGVRLLSLPSFRPVVEIGEGVVMRMVDGTSLAIQRTPPGTPPRIAISHGRLVFRADRSEDFPVSIDVGQRRGTLTLAGGRSAAALEVSRDPGRGDPETEPGPSRVVLHALEGKVAWQERPEEKKIVLNAPYHFPVFGRAADSPIAMETPAWLADQPPSPSESRASRLVEKSVSSDKPAQVTLVELAADRRKEVRWLALRCLGQLAAYEPFFHALDDAEQKLMWDDCAEELRAAIIRDPQSAAQVRATAERLYAKDGTTLYELLWRFRTGELKNDDTALLVKLLEDPRMAFRVLSYWNLRMTSRVGLPFNPDDPPAKRHNAVQRWRALLNATLGPKRGGSPPRTVPRGAAERPADNGAAPPREASPEEPPAEERAPSSPTDAGAELPGGAEAGTPLPDAGAPPGDAVPQP